MTDKAFEFEGWFVIHCHPESSKPEMVVDGLGSEDIAYDYAANIQSKGHTIVSIGETDSLWGDLKMYERLEKEMENWKDSE